MLNCRLLVTAHKRNVDLKAVKKRKALNTSEVFEIRDLDLRPTLTAKNLH